MAVPIWKDKEVTLGAADWYDFQIRTDSNSGEIIYTGRAYKRPGAANCVARVNDICVDYIQPKEPTSTPAVGGAVDGGVIRAFVVQVYESGAWTDKETITFVNDWSYDPDFDHATAKCLSDPITGVLDARQYFLQTSLYANASNSFTIAFDGGTTGTYQLIGSHGLSVNWLLGLSRWAASFPGSLTMNGKTWRVENTCARWVLHYINAYGGWDSIVCVEKATRRDAYDRYTTRVDYDNSNPRNRGIVEYVNEVRPTLELHTDWLTDEQCARMHHLLGSRWVYLEDLTNPAVYSIVPATLIPVLITDTECEYKDFRNQGRQLCSYTINVELGQERYRR